jgi:hypothetical protein
MRARLTGERRIVNRPGHAYTVRMNLRIVLLIPFIIAGCAQQKSEPQPALRAMGKSVAPDETRSDETIGREVRQQLDLASHEEMAGVVVEVEDAVVTVRGTVARLPMAFRAEAAAHAVKGVKAVRNLLQVDRQPITP